MKSDNPISISGSDRLRLYSDPLHPPIQKSPLQPHCNLTYPDGDGMESRPDYFHIGKHLLGVVTCWGAN